MQWNIDLTAPPLKSTTQQSKIKQECDPGDPEKEDKDDKKFGCSSSANKEAKQFTFLPGSQQQKFVLEMQLKAMVQSFADDQALFFEKFGPALGKLGRVGYAIDGQIEVKEPKFTRLGTLKEVDLTTCEL